MNIAQHIERAARHFPDRPAILFDGQSITYSELPARVDRAAHALVDTLGLQPGDRVALFLPNIPEFAVAYLAVQKADGRFEARELQRDDPAAILYTSGTTGQQKGATLSQCDYHSTPRPLKIRFDAKKGQA